MKSTIEIGEEGHVKMGFSTDPLDQSPKEENMKLPEYITGEEVKRVCNEIGLRDWSKITDPTVSEEEAATILKIVNT
jgi:hypothetical protein